MKSLLLTMQDCTNDRLSCTLGYPTNQNFNYDTLASLLHFHLNNAGDPFLGSSFSLNSTRFEVCVLDWFANLWEIEKNKYWGYVTTGGTEGNLHGILVGREQLPDGILYTSQDSHYSIFKIARMYRMQCMKVSTLVSGEINCVDLKALLLAHKDKPAIINLNIGTTMKGGVDDLDLVIQTLQECGFTRDRFYIHCDGALFGMMLPFVEQGSSFSLNSTTFEVCVLNWFTNLWEIKKNEYWGYVTTGGTEGNLHGILVGREQLPDGILYTSQDSHYSIFKIARMYRMKCMKVSTLTSGEIDCVNLKDLVLTHKDKPAIINLNIGTTMKGAIDDLDLVIQTLEECGFTRDRFYIHCDGALFGMMLPFVKQAPRITFKKPIGSVTVSGHKFLGCPIPCGIVITRLEYINALSKNVEIIASRDATITGSRCGHAPIFLWWNLACNGNIAHVVVMQHITIEMLDSFGGEFRKKRSFWFEDGQLQPLCIANDIGSRNCVCSMHRSLS
ncbi:hypothetical protein JHK82_028935 [Glycine max]|nr:hypothetical protein JHK87_028849 [Glycine soja]KAG4998157.1 hypothetical protein JHK85_029596 [Glycine max]KAG5128100.1 hypothetical protein JHK82_028935 [Glycine max]